MQNLQTRLKRTRMGAMIKAWPLAEGQDSIGDGSPRRTITRKDGEEETGGPCCKDRSRIRWSWTLPKRRIIQLTASMGSRKRWNRNHRRLRPIKTECTNHRGIAMIICCAKEDELPFSQCRKNFRSSGQDRSTGLRQSVGAPAACKISMAADMCVPMVSTPWESSPGTTSMPMSMACFNMGADR